MSWSPTVSVVIPAYNAQATLSACLASVCALTYPKPKFSVLAVDNNSTDATRSIIESFAPQVQYLAAKKQGRGAARNCGIAHAESDVIAFTDADCVVDADWLTALVEPLSDETVGIVGGANRATRPCNAIELFGEQIHDHEKALTVYEPPYAITMNWASPRVLLQTLNGFDETLRRDEDVDLAWRILQHGKRLVYQPRAIVAHANENTLRGLFHEGVKHGYYSVILNRKHAAFLKPYGRPRFYRASYVRLWRHLSEYRRTRSIQSLCEFIFNSGKKVGMWLASARTGYIEI